jgi:hypothetical protein
MKNWKRIGTVAGLSRAAVALGLLVLIAGSGLAQDIIDDATILALEVDGASGIIRANEATVVAIESDLTKIIAFDPFFATIHVFPDWSPGSVGITLTQEAFDAFVAGTYTGFDGITATYPLASTSTFASYRYVGLRFDEALHSANLAALFPGIEGVESAWASSRGGDDHDITCTGPGMYLYRYAWGDCPAGCIYSHYWQIMVSGETVQIVNEYGFELPLASDDLGWDSLKAMYR